MKYLVEVKMVTGETHNLVFMAGDANINKIFNLGKVTYIDFQINNNQCLILNPQHIVSVLKTEGAQ